LPAAVSELRLAGQAFREGPPERVAQRWTKRRELNKRA